jgi:hypothetical protein
MTYYLNEARPMDDSSQRMNCKWKKATRQDTKLAHHVRLQWEVRVRYRGGTVSVFTEAPWLF